MHARAIDPHDRLGQETCREPHLGGDLPADQFVNLNLVGRGHHFSIAIVDFELRGRDFRVIFFILEAHGALHLGAA